MIIQMLKTLLLFQMNRDSQKAKPFKPVLWKPCLTTAAKRQLLADDISESDRKRISATKPILIAYNRTAVEQSVSDKFLYGSRRVMKTLPPIDAQDSAPPSQLNDEYEYETVCEFVTFEPVTQPEFVPVLMDPQAKEVMGVNFGKALEDSAKLNTELGA